MNSKIAAVRKLRTDLKGTHIILKFDKHNVNFLFNDTKIEKKIATSN